jgi:hypothetical protein
LALYFQHKPTYEEFEEHEQEREEEGNISSLDDVFYETPNDDLKRRLVENDNFPEDVDKMKIDEHLNSFAIVDPEINQVYETRKR